MKQEIQLLQEALNTIQNLRRENEILIAKVSTFESMMLLFQTPPAYLNLGMSPDVTYEIKKFIELNKDQEIDVS